MAAAWANSYPIYPMNSSITTGAWTSSNFTTMYDYDKPFYKDAYQEVQAPNLVAATPAIPEDPLVWLDREVDRVCKKATAGLIAYRGPVRVEAEAKSVPVTRCTGYTLAGERCRKTALKNSFTCGQHTAGDDWSAEDQYVMINNKYGYAWCDDGGPPLAVGDYVILPSGMAGRGPWTGRVTSLIGKVPPGMTPRKILSRA